MSLKKTIFTLAALIFFSSSPLHAESLTLSPVDSEGTLSFTVIFDGSLVTERSVIIRNDTSSAMPIDDISVFGDGVIQRRSDDCPRGVLAVGTQCEVVLDIRPIDYSRKTAILMISYTSGGIGYGLNYNMAVDSVPNILLSTNPGTSDGHIPIVGAFASGASFESQHRVQITNNGIAAVPILDIVPVTSGTVRVISHNCPAGAGLAVGASCEAILGFRPIDYSTSFVDLLVVGRTGAMELGLGFQVVATAVEASDLALTLSPNASSTPVSSDITYTLNIQNNSDLASRASVEVSATLPSGSEFVSASLGSCHYNSSTRELLCQVPAIAARATTSSTIVVKATAIGSLVQVVNMSSPTDINAANNSAQSSVTVTAAVANNDNGAVTELNPPPSGPTGGDNGGCALSSNNLPTSSLGMLLFGIASLLLLGMLRKSARN